LTAIEDFQSAHPSDYRFCQVDLAAGLGIMEYPRKAFSESVAFLLLRIKAWIYSSYGLVLRLQG